MIKEIVEQSIIHEVSLTYNYLQSNPKANIKNSILKKKTKRKGEENHYILEKNKRKNSFEESEFTNDKTRKNEKIEEPSIAGNF